MLSLKPAQDHKRKLNKLTQSKFLTQLYILKLVDLNSPLTKHYWKTFHCASQLTTVGDHIFTRHCKLRFCIVCSRKRCVEQIHSYKPTIDKWHDKHLLTLSVRNVTDEHLRPTIDLMHKELCNAKRAINKRRKLLGIREIRLVAHFEVTENVKFGDYHPHLHCIVSTKKDGQDILREWYERFPKQDVSERGQDLRPADEKSVRELFKYFTKIISTKNDERVISANGLDTIFQATAGKRTFFAYGVKKLSNEKVSNVDEILADLDQQTEQAIVSHFQYVHDYKAYINTETGELLTEFEVSESLQNLKVEINYTKPIYHRDHTPVQTVKKRNSLKAYPLQL
jgi:hypothetical protein